MRWSGGQIGHIVTIYFRVRMEGQLGAPFHFAVEFLVLVVALGGAFDALKARRDGAGRWALGQALGFLSLAAAQFVHGALIVQADANTTVIVLRAVAFGLLALSARPAVALERAPLEPIIAASAMPALFFAGPHASIAVIPVIAAIAVAARGFHAHRAYRSPTTLAFTAAFGAFAVAEATTALSDPGTGALLIFAHSMRAVGALLLARWLWTSIVRSVRLRFVAAFVAVLTIAVLIVSAALNVVIGNTLQTNELNRLLEAGNARQASIQNLGEGALVPAQITAGSSAVVDALRKGRPLDLSGLFRLLPLDFVMLVDANGKTLSPTENVPGLNVAGFAPRKMALSEAIAIAGSDVVQQAYQGGFQGQTAESVQFASGKGAGRTQTQLLVVAAYPARSAGRIIGAVVVGYRIDHNFLLLVRQDTVAEASILVGDQVSSTTFGSQGTVAQAFSRLDFTQAREQGEPLQRLVTIGGSQYVSAFVPLKSSDGRVVGLLALSRRSTTLADAQRNITRTLFLITLAVALIAALLAWLSGGRVTKPLRSLTGAARQLRAGQFSARTHVESVDEVGTLGTAFNEMADELQRQTGQLQRSAATEATLRARMEAILQSMGDGLIATDAGGTVVTFNRAAEEILRVRAQSVVRRPLGDVMRGQAVTGRTLAEAAMLGGATEGTLVRADGTQLAVAITAAPLLDSSGSPVGRVVVLRDVSREHEAERMKSEFLANVSHELRTPITPIKGYAEMMARKKFPRAKEESFLQGILQSTERLERVVEILVDFAAMEAGRLKARVEPVPVKELVARLTDKWKERDGDHRFVRKIGASVPAVMGDPKLLGRSLDELVDNAVKFSPDGGPIEITAEPYSNGSRRTRVSRVRITVRDHGIGIEPEQMPDLFQDFRQGDGSETRSYGGLGLGLAYVKRIASVHGGDVMVESEPGKGSSFSLVLPAASAGRITDVTKRARKGR